MLFTALYISAVPKCVKTPNTLWGSSDMHCSVNITEATMKLHTHLNYSCTLLDSENNNIQTHKFEMPHCSDKFPGTFISQHTAYHLNFSTKINKRNLLWYVLLYVSWLKMLGLYLYTLIIGRKSCNMLSIRNKLT